jgi:hypothetical protein
VKGVGGPQLIVDEEGVLDGFFPVYASDKTKANVLSFADVEDLYDITYIRKRAFVVHMSDRDLVFNRRQKLYVVDWGTVGIVAAMIQENERLYTKEEINRAKLAYEFVRNSGYPSLGEVVHLITDGNIRNLTEHTQADAVGCRKSIQDIRFPSGVPTWTNGEEDRSKNASRSHIETRG